MPFLWVRHYRHLIGTTVAKIVQNEQGEALVDPTQTTAGDQLNIRLARGRLKAITAPDPIVPHSLEASGPRSPRALP